MSKTARLAAGEFREGVSVTAKRKNDSSGYTMHGHDFYELDIVLSGKTVTVLNNRPVCADKGHVFFLTPEDFHSFPRTPGLEIFNLHFTAESVPTELLFRLTESTTRVYTPDDAAFTKILSIATTIEAFTAEEHPNDEVLKRLLECILLLLLEGEAKESAIKGRSEGMQRAVIYILAHFRENPSLGQVAASLHMNERYFCKKFKEYTGKTYKDFLRKKKLRYARRLVLATSLPITEIAAESGYATLSHFNREFKDFFGSSPLTLKKQYEEKARTNP